MIVDLVVCQFDERCSRMIVNLIVYSFDRFQSCCVGIAQWFLIKMGFREEHRACMKFALWQANEKMGKARCAGVHDMMMANRKMWTQFHKALVTKENVLSVGTASSQRLQPLMPR